MTRRWTFLVALSLLAFVGCDGTPTEIDGGTMVFEGQVETLGASTHLFSITTSGGVQIDVLSVVADPELEQGTASLGLGLGEPDAEGECLATFRGTAITGSKFNFGLEERTYCIVMFDNGTMAEDALRIYAVQISPTAS